MNLELEEFKPKEAELVSGVTQASIGNWRRSGHWYQLQRGHARYNLIMILEMFALGMLTSRGLRIDAAKNYSQKIAGALLQNLIWDPKTYSEQVLKATGELERDLPDAVEASTADEVKRLQAASVAGRAVQTAIPVSGEKPPTWFIIWANGETQFYFDEDVSDETFFGNTVYDAFVQGPVTLLCIGALAQLVLDRLPRPAFRMAKEA